MTTDQLRSWMTQYQQADRWWLAFPSGTHPEPVTLSQVEQTLTQYPQQKISVLHVDQATTGSQDWVVLSNPVAAVAAAVAAAIPAAKPASAVPAGDRTGATGRRTGTIGRRTGTAGHRTGALGRGTSAIGRAPGHLNPDSLKTAAGVVGKKNYGGVNRLLYFINLIVLVMLVGFCMLLAFTLENFAFIIAAIIIQPIGAFLLLWLRIKNIGWSPWLSLLAFIPPIGLLLGPPAIAFPEGFADKKKLDVMAIVILSLVALLFIVPIIIGIMQPEWLKNPYEGKFD